VNQSRDFVSYPQVIDQPLELSCSRTNNPKRKTFHEVFGPQILENIVLVGRVEVFVKSITVNLAFLVDNGGICDSPIWHVLTHALLLTSLEKVWSQHS